MEDNTGDVREGDLREGVGGMKVRVRVSTINLDSRKAYCVLVKSGKSKVLSLATLRNAYRLVQRSCAGGPGGAQK